MAKKINKVDEKTLSKINYIVDAIQNEFAERSDDSMLGTILLKSFTLAQCLRDYLGTYSKMNVPYEDITIPVAEPDNVAETITNN